MSEEILVNVTPRETRVAVVENGMLQELHIERGWRRGVVGNIYKGRVQRVMPGMQAAFVELGLERAAFLHANDVVRPAPVDAGQTEDAPPQPISTPSIVELLRDGQEIVVQVVKDPIGTCTCGGTGAGASPSAVSSGALRKMSLACRNAARSRPMSTKAACIPGITRCTLPL